MNHEGMEPVSKNVMSQFDKESLTQTDQMVEPGTSAAKFGRGNSDPVGPAGSQCYTRGQNWIGKLEAVNIRHQIWGPLGNGHGLDLASPK